MHASFDAEEIHNDNSFPHEFSPLHPTHGMLSFQIHCSAVACFAMRICECLLCFFLIPCEYPRVPGKLLTVL